VLGHSWFFDYVGGGPNNGKVGSTMHSLLFWWCGKRVCEAKKNSAMKDKRVGRAKSPKKEKKN